MNYNLSNISNVGGRLNGDWLQTVQQVSRQTGLSAAEAAVVAKQRGLYQSVSPRHRRTSSRGYGGYQGGYGRKSRRGEEEYGGYEEEEGYQGGYSPRSRRSASSYGKQGYGLLAGRYGY